MNLFILGGAKRIVHLLGCKMEHDHREGNFFEEPLELSGSVGEGPEERGEKISMLLMEVAWNTS